MNYTNNKEHSFPDAHRPFLSEADRLPEDVDPRVDPCSLSPDLHDPEDFSPKSPLSCADSGGSTDYEDFWRPPSPSASPGTHAQHSCAKHEILKPDELCLKMQFSISIPFCSFWPIKPVMGTPANDGLFQRLKVFFFCRNTLQSGGVAGNPPQNNLARSRTRHVSGFTALLICFSRQWIRRNRCPLWWTTLSLSPCPSARTSGAATRESRCGPRCCSRASTRPPWTWMDVRAR